MFLNLLRYATLLCSILCTTLPASAQQDILLAPGDRLSFWIIGTLDTPREVLLQADGTVLLPLVGTLPIEGQTIAQARQSLTEHLRNFPVRLSGDEGRGTRLGLSTNEIGLDVAQYRPVYLSGDVNIIGEVEFRPNLTARQAIVKAGGLLRLDFSTADELPLGLMTQRARLEQQIAESQTLLQLLVAQYELLDPEARPADNPILAKILQADTTGEVLAQIDIQKRLLQQESLNQEATLEQLQARMDVVESLEKSSENTVQIAADTITRLTKLADQGLVRTEAMDNARQNLLQAQTRTLEAASERLRLGIEISNIRDSVKTDALVTTADILADIDKELTQIETAQAQLKVLGWDSPQFDSTEPETARVAKLTLYRAAEGKTEPRPIALDDVLLPGDVVDVALQ